jgi:uncharacterized membrane protein
MNTKHTRRLSIASLLAAIICVTTALLKIPTGITNGYVHLGDMFIFLSASVLGPYAAIPAAIGSGLADLLAGYPLYIIPTIIIKGVMGFIAGKFYKPNNRILYIITILLTCELFMALGYWAFETILYGVAAATAAVSMNLLQGLFGVIGGVVIVRLIPERVYKAYLW